MLYFGYALKKSQTLLELLLRDTEYILKNVFICLLALLILISTFPDADSILKAKNGQQIYST